MRLRTLAHQNRETRRKFNRTCDRAFTSMKSVALGPDQPTPAAKLKNIIQANGFMMAAYQGGFRIKAKPTVLGRVRKTISKWIPGRLRRLLSERRLKSSGGAIEEDSYGRLYSEKDLVKRLHIVMTGSEVKWFVFRMGRHFRRAVELSELQHDSKLHLILLNAVVSAGVCSRLDVPIHGRVFVCLLTAVLYWE